MSNITKERQGDFFDEYKPDETALAVNKGVEQPPVVNPYLDNIVSRGRKQRAQMSVDEYMEGIAAGDTVILSKAITLVESYLPEHRKMAHELIIRCLQHSKRKESMRIGITGSPVQGRAPL